MLFYMGLLLLVIAVSLDGFGVGITYGMKKTKVPANALFVIMICSGVIVLLSMTIGEVLTSFISPNKAKVFGGLILVLIGVFSLVNIMRTKKPLTKGSKNLHQVKAVLSTPAHADLDDSGVISIGEAFLLGTALALDAFGAGLGAAIIGYSPILTAISVAFMSAVFLYCGLQIGTFLLKSEFLTKFSFLPPLLLIILGVYNMF